MSPEESHAVPKDVGNSKPNVDDEFFTIFYVRRNHPKHVPILLTGLESEGGARSVPPGDVIRFCLQRKDYSSSPVEFKTPVSPLRSFDKWMQFMISQDCVRASLTKAQIIDAVAASATLQIRKDIPGLVAFISRWCPDTHTAICRWSEMTISLESVVVLLNLPITGNINIKLSEDEEGSRAALVAKSKGFVRKENETRCFYSWWVSQWFPDELEPDQNNSMLHVAAFLALWLSRDIFNDGSGKKEIRPELINFS